MTPIDAYIFLFIDSILASLALVSNTEMAYVVMKLFGSYNLLYMVVIAVIGNVIGSCLNYIFGYIAHEAKRQTKRYQDSQKLKDLASFANKYLIYLAIFSFVPIWGVIITLAAGFLCLSVRRFMLLVLVGRVLYYCVPLLLQG